MNLQTGIAEVNGAKLYFESAGEGEPLVLIHGLALDTRMWDDQFAVFANHFKVIRYDARGFGKSSLPTAQTYSHADDLKALLDYLHISSTHVLGLSMGASIAIDFVVSHPGKTLKLIMSSGGPSGTMPEEGFQTLVPIFEQAKTFGPKAANDAWLKHPLFLRANEIPVIAE
jgi:pimeloyl-ACP methyl ester carboxylesterase